MISQTLIIFVVLKEFRKNISNLEVKKKKEIYKKKNFLNIIIFINFFQFFFFKVSYSRILSVYAACSNDSDQI